MIEKKKRGRPKKVEPVVKEEVKAPPVQLPIKYTGIVLLNPYDLRFAEIEVGSFVYDTKTNEATVNTSTFPPAWKQFETGFNVGNYTILDSKTGTELQLNKTEDVEKWIQYIEEAEFETVRGIYRIARVNKVYEAQ